MGVMYYDGRFYVREGSSTIEKNEKNVKSNLKEMTEF